MENLEKICQYLKEAETYYLATMDGDQPRVRPFGTIHLFEGKLYIQTSKEKACSKQIGKNPKVEICAMKGETWLRVCGELENDDRIEAKASLLDEYEHLKTMYDAKDDKVQVLYFKNATATFYSYSGEAEVIQF